MKIARFIIIAFACSLIFFSNTLSATAGIFKSDPSKGEVHLDAIQEKTDKVAQEDPLNLKEVQSAHGLNEVQGEADKDKMISPETAKGTSVIDNIKDALSSDK